MWQGTTHAVRGGTVGGVGGRLVFASCGSCNEEDGGDEAEAVFTGGL